MPQQHCHNCGVSLKQGDTFCANCGTPIMQQQATVPGGRKGQGKLTVIIVIVCAVIVAAVAALFVINYVSRTDSDSKVSANVDEERSAGDYIDLGYRYLRDGDYDNAILAFEKAIKIDSKLKDAYVGLSDVYIVLEDYDRALEVLEEGYSETGDSSLEYRIETVTALTDAQTEVSPKPSPSEASPETAPVESASPAASAQASAATETLATPSETPAATTAPSSAPASVSPAATTPPTTTMNYAVGDRITLGKYNGAPISWIVLDVRGTEAFLISESVLTQRMYYGEFADTNGNGEVDYPDEYDINGDGGVDDSEWERFYCTWETSDIRKWLNGSFYSSAFTSAEKAKIKITNVVNKNNPEYGTAGGNNTNDRVFLLSIEEANSYFSDDNARSTGDAWWLRLPGSGNGRAVYVVFSGWFDDAGAYVYHNSVGVRPALWLNLES